MFYPDVGHVLPRDITSTTDTWTIPTTWAMRYLTLQYAIGHFFLGYVTFGSEQFAMCHELMGFGP